MNSEHRIDSSGPQVSVVIPCYNQADFVGETIESAINQTYGNIEIVVVDDGSTDHTPDVVGKYPTVRYIRQNNQGNAGTYNRGLRESTGTYVIFVDGDDKLLLTAVEAGLDCFRAHPESAFVFGRYKNISSDGTFLRDAQQFDIGDDSYLALLRANCVGPPCAAMFRRDALIDVGGFEPTPCLDYDVYLRIARHSAVASHDAFVAEYRRHEDQLSNNVGLMLTTALAALRAQWPYVRTNRQYREAFRIGERTWKESYGFGLLVQLIDYIQTPGKGRQAMRSLVALLPIMFAPWFVYGVAKRVNERLARSYPSGWAHKRRSCDLNGNWDAVYKLQSGRVIDDIVVVKQEGGNFVGYKVIGNEYVKKGQSTIMGTLSTTEFIKTYGYHANYGWIKMDAKLDEDYSSFVFEYRGTKLSFNRQ